MQGEYITVAEAADQFGIPKYRLYQWIEAKKLPTFEREFDKKIMVRPGDVQAVIDSQNRVVPRGD